MLESPSPRSPAAGSRLSALVSRATRDLEEETVMTATLEPTTTVKSAKAPAVSPADVIRKAHEAGVQIVDVRFCDLADPVTGARYSRDPRYVARKAEEYLVKTGIATTAYFGPEAEFYIFNSVRFDQNAHEGYYHIDSEE